MLEYIVFRFEQIIYLFELKPLFYLATLFVLGALVGSFLNVVIYRLPIMLQRDWRQQCLEILEQEPDAETETFNLYKPRSRCAHCGHQITALENIPLLSYLALGGKCSACRIRISIRYPLVELFTAVVSIVVGWHFGVTQQAAAALLLTWSLIALAGIDIEHKLLPDDITLPLLWSGVLLSLFHVFVDLQTSVIGAMAGYLSLWSVFVLFKLVTDKEGMGHGDFKLLAALGAWLGWKPLLVVVLTSSVVGAVVGISMILLKRSERGTQIPFGPYLAAAGWITLLQGENLMRYYFSLFGL
ncbi:MAG TPA: A24 family peptidase [Gammaproteobacteria bacterium]|nr:A24 family peptidase [Gammaproteobacteria bacterium]